MFAADHVFDELGRRHRRLRSQASEQLEIDDQCRFVAGFARHLLRAAGVGVDQCGAGVMEDRDRLRQQLAISRGRARVTVDGQVVVLWP